MSLDQRVNSNSVVNSNCIHDFQRKVTCVTEFRPTDADLSKTEAVASGISKPHFFFFSLHIFLFRTNNKMPLCNTIQHSTDMC